MTTHRRSRGPSRYGERRVAPHLAPKGWFIRVLTPGGLELDSFPLDPDPDVRQRQIRDATEVARRWLAEHPDGGEMRMLMYDGDSGRFDTEMRLAV